VLACKNAAFKYLSRGDSKPTVPRAASAMLCLLVFVGLPGSLPYPCHGFCFILVVASSIQVMESMVEKHVHRVYIVDNPASDLPKPITVITTSDMMEVIAKYHKD
jgi:Na+-translocating ferredoxin:NAD+ oxidoreductase RnfA subunit